MDRSYVYRAVNDAYLLAHNHRREEIVGRSVAEMLGQETFDRIGQGQSVPLLGLGLVLCKRFVELLGGRMQVESTVQAGSRFTFYIPE